MNIVSRLLIDTTNAFLSRYHALPKWYAAAPGRVNLIGEHTDYNDGFVLPMAIECYTVFAAGPSDGPLAEVYSMNKGESASIRIDGVVAPPETIAWSNYVQGTVDCVAEKGLRLDKPFRAVFASNVPLGGGLSSSASLEVATATLIEEIVGKNLDGVEKALACQRAEHLYAKMPCGIMDQFISTLGKQGYAMLLDCRSKEPRMIPMDDPNVLVLIANSNVKHELTGSEYPDRRRQCEKAAKLLGVDKLRDATLPMLDAAKKIFDTESDGEICFRRARHIVTENDRTVHMADALVAKDWKTCGKLMNASHVSMRDDFEISCPEIDVLVDIARSLPGVIGSRMTGGGFGGCTVSLVETDKVDQITEAIAASYKEKTKCVATIFATRSAQGALKGEFVDSIGTD